MGRQSCRSGRRDGGGSEGSHIKGFRVAEGKIEGSKRRKEEQKQL